MDKIPPKTNHTIRLSVTAEDFIRGLADEHRTRRSIVIRAMLTVAAKYPREIAQRIKELTQ